MKRKWTEEAIIEYIKNEGYVFIKFVFYKALDSRVLIQCSKKHKPYEVSFRNFKGNKSKKPRRCPYCNNKELVYFKDIKEYANNNGYDILIKDDEYKNMYQTLKFKHRKCGEITELSFINFKSRLERNNEPCDICANRIEINYQYVYNEMKKYGYKLLSIEYNNAHELLKVECNHSHKFFISWNKFQQGRRCPYCNTTYGERNIIEYLENNSFYYIYDKGYFEDLISDDNKVLRPDFIIPDKKIWIEFDGIQHFEPTDFAGKGEKWAKEQFEKNKYHDQLKNKYAIENNWKLIRIPYWELNNIKSILEKELK